MDRDPDRGDSPVPASRPLERQPVSRERCETPQPSREHGLVRVRGSLYRVSAAELETMRDIGRFRTVALEDLARFRYQGVARLVREDLRAMAAQGLVQTRNLANGPRVKALPVAVLTKLGKELLEAEPHGSQRVFAGFVKPKEVRHDAAIYRMYQAERAEDREAPAGGSHASFSTTNSKRGCIGPWPHSGRNHRLCPRPTTRDGKRKSHSRTVSRW